MSEHKWDAMNDSDFDSMLRAGLPELPPDDVVSDVTPWTKAMDRVLVGLALNAITLNFLLLDHLLPAIGLVLLLLGLRSLRRENGWFRACYIAVILKALYFFPSLILNATVYRSAISGPAVTYLTAASFALTLFLFICLWRGFKAVKAKAGLPADAGAAAALIVWYLVIAALALAELGGLVVGVVMVGSYILIIRGLCELSKEMGEAGYAIRAAAARIPDAALVRVIAVLLAAGIICGYLFGNGYRMDWEPVAEQESSDVADIKARLRELGFPENVLDDLTDEDVLDCAGALRVVTDVTDEPVNDGREVVEYEGGTTYHTTVYDEKELRVTGVAVELPGERETWKVFHHFLWVIDPGFYGTEAIQLWPTSQIEGWDTDGEVTGRVLYSKDGAEYSSPYYFLGSKTFTLNSAIWGQQTSTDVFAEFSMPGNAEKQRGYVSYTAEAHYADLRYIVSSWFNYTHQKTWAQYPAKTAAEHCMSGAWNHTGAFITVQDALQFYNTDDGIDMIS